MRRFWQRRKESSLRICRVISNNLPAPLSTRDLFESASISHSRCSYFAFQISCTPPLFVLGTFSFPVFAFIKARTDISAFRVEIPEIFCPENGANFSSEMLQISTDMPNILFPSLLLHPISHMPPKFIIPSKTHSCWSFNIQQRSESDQPACCCYRTFGHPKELENPKPKTQR